jgi:hypothetical protein
MASSAALVESLSAPSDFRGLFAPLPRGTLAGELTADAGAAVDASDLTPAPFAASFAALGFFDGFSFPGSALRFVPAPVCPPEQ